MPRETRAVAIGDTEVRFSNGTTVQLGPFAGAVTQWSGGGRGLRSPMLPAERDTSAEFDHALEEVGIVEQETVHLDVTSMSAGVQNLRGAAAVDRVVIRPAPPIRDSVQVVWYQDESGGVSFHFPDGFLENASPRKTPEATRVAVLRASRQAVFTIPARTASARTAFATGQPSERLRGPIVKLGRKVFKVLLVPLSKIIAKPLETIVGRIEKKYRQELIRGVSLANYRKDVRVPFTDWASLDGKRTLLIVHGIFSSTQGMLSGLPPAAMDGLIQHYEGRVIALDQLTVTRSPAENATGFLKTVLSARPSGRFSFDVLCHSRGGIVTRTLAERGTLLVPKHNCEFRNVFFVATPNAGSPLGDARHIVDMIDVFTNMMTNFPDGGVLYSLEVILAIVKLIAYAAETRLPGLADMGTRGYIPETLNNAAQGSPARYAAAASNYEPRPEDNGFINGRIADSVIDRVFENTANDLVVPRDGVFGDNGHPSFPIANPLVYGDSDHVWHTDFFSRQPTIDAIFHHFDITSTPIVVSPTTTDGGRPPSAGVAERGNAEEMANVLLEATTPGGSVIDLLPSRTRSVSATLRLPTLGSMDLPSGRAREVRRGVVRSPSPRTTRAKPPTPPPPTPLPEPAPIERHPEIAFHERVVAGETNQLWVRLSDLVSAGGLGGLMIGLKAGEESVDIMVRLHAPGFEVKPRSEGSMTVHRVRVAGSEEVSFNLKARNPGKGPLRREISAEFWLRNAMIGAVTHYTVVVPKNYDGPGSDGSSRIEAFVIPPVRRQDCDLIVMIEGRELGQSPFRVRLRSEIPDHEYASLDCGLMNLPQTDLSTYIQTALQQLIGNYPNPALMSRTNYEKDLKTWNRDFLARISALGKQLWTFLPQGFRTEYFDLYAQGVAPRSILIHSDEMLFPRELVVPNEMLKGRFVELTPLGITHVLGRWKPGLKMKPSPQRMKVQKFVVINPAYLPPNDLPWTVAEAVALGRLLPNLEVYHPSTANRIQTDLLQRSDVGLLHFSGHGEFNPANADLSALLVEENGRLDALAIARTPLGMQASPIVYLNACSVGSAGVTVGRAGGFAAACLDGGFSGVIAPYWPVNDERAANFSIALYQKLLAGRAIGEALQELRDEHREDSTFLAFAYFGDPWTRADFV